MRKLIGWTYHDHCDLPDDGSFYEVLDGYLVCRPAARRRHQIVVQNAVDRLGELLDMDRSRGLFAAPITVVLADSVVLEPDIVYVRPEHRARINLQGIFGAPDLVVEVSSRHTRERDFTAKRQLYQRYGVREYWVLDPDASELVIFSRLARGVYRSVDTFEPGEVAISREFGWRIDVHRLFRR